MNEWISVKDRLPDKKGRYLCCSKSLGNFGRGIVISLFVLDLAEFDHWSFDEDKDHRPGWTVYESECGFVEDKGITHWMPLPELPEEVCV